MKEEQDVKEAVRPQKKICLKVNGKKYTVEIPTTRLLVDCLRYDVGLTGTKEGCSVGVCGACTVLIDGKMIRQGAARPESETECGRNQRLDDGESLPLYGLL